MPVLVAGDDREGGKEVVFHTSVEGRHQLHAIDRKTLGRANARDHLGLESQEIRNQSVEWFLNGRHECRDGSCSQSARGRRDLPDQPANKIATVPRRRSTPAFTGFRQAGVHKREHRFGCEIQVRDTFGG
jgi:hypothetical protein